MPSPGVIKIYVEGGYYHVFNRGNNKQRIFLDDTDYKVFLGYFWGFVKNPHPDFHDSKQDVFPLTYCLMRTHLHFQLIQKSVDGITNLMRRLMVKYVRYFNKKYNRVGGLFQSSFRAKHITDEVYLLHLSRYIHLNPRGVWKKPLELYPYSSYGQYLGTTKVANSMIDTEEILSFFKSAQRLSLRGHASYQAFVEDYIEEEDVLFDCLS